MVQNSAQPFGKQVKFKQVLNLFNSQFYSYSYKIGVVIVAT